MRKYPYLTTLQSCKVLFAIVYCFLQFEVDGQQNLFNIPSGDITSKGKIFYQHQFNVYEDKLESKGHLVVGLGRGWEVGANLVGKGFYFTSDWRMLHNSNPSQGALYPVLLGTVQKSYPLNEQWKVNVGGQGGVNLSSSIGEKEFNYFVYSLVAWAPAGHHLKLIAGPYYTTPMFVGEGNRAGVMAGFEARVTRGWYVMGDWISGNNDSSSSVVGLMKTVSKRVQICAGYMIPNPGTPKPPAVVIELNIQGWDFEEN